MADLDERDHDDRATLGALEDLDALEERLRSIRERFGVDHPTVRDELRGAWKQVAAMRRWLGDTAGNERITRAVVLGEL